MPSRDALFECEGEMAERMASHDWSTTPLGPVETWSQSLRTSVGILLRSRYPMILSWGEHLVMLYNDAFIPTLGTKHPRAVGGLLREEFAEVWDAIGAMQESVLAGGPATWDEDLPLTIERGTGPEEFFFTFSYSHVPDEAGPGGVLAVLSVTTDKVVAARRMGLLHELALVASEATTPDEAMATALGVLAAAQNDLVGGALYRRSAEGVDDNLFRRAGAFGTTPPAEAPLAVVEPDHPVTRAFASRRPVHGELPADDGPRHCVALPLRSQDAVDSVLLLFPHPLRPYDADHERFVGLLSEQVSQILAVATARASERARIEALNAIDAAKTAFLSSVSHEFRTPLTLLLGPLEDVLAGRASALGRDEAEVMYQSAHRLLRMVNALLDVARVEADGLSSRPEATDLVGISRDLLQPFEDAARRVDLALVTELDAELGAVMADPELWEKILTNLVANAVKFTREGTVRVTLAREDDVVALRVADTGVGIPESEIDRVFERFHRVVHEDSRTIEGTGVGLTLVAESARAMDGTATVESRPGVGSVFEVRIPYVAATAGASSFVPHVSAATMLADEVAVAQAMLPSAAAAPEDASAPLVLVVEDNAAMRSRVARLLGSLGRVRTAPDGIAALEVLRSEHVDLVVTDAMMPRLDGLGLLDAIRSDEDLRGTPVVLLSARAGADAAAGAIDAGADDYVVKPFTPGELLARCRTTLELARYRGAAAAGRVRSALLAGVSHDMQTPLAVISTSLGLLGEHDISEEDREHLSRRALARAGQLTRLVTQFLDWSRLSMNEPLPVRIEEVDLVAVVGDIAADNERIKVTGELPTSPVWCDRQRTEQILHNLIENAQRVARTGIEIRFDGDSDNVAVRIADDGAGVSDEVLPWLFEAFGPTTAARGNGLGLHVSREAAKAQGGALVLESTGPDGSVFALRIPRQRSR